MSTNLRRVLDTTRAVDRAHVQSLIKDIHALAVRLKTDPPDGSIWSVEESPEFFNAITPLWQAPEALDEVKSVDVADDRISLEMLKKFSNLPHIRLHDLRKNVEICLERPARLRWRWSWIVSRPGMA